MAEPGPADSDVSAGSTKMHELRERLQTRSTRHLPPCPPVTTASGRLSAVATPSVTRTRTSTADQLTTLDPLSGGLTVGFGLGGRPGLEFADLGPAPQAPSGRGGVRSRDGM